MAGWKVPQYKTVPMPDDIADGLWIKIHHPRRLPFEAVQRFIALAPKGATEDANFDVEGARDLTTSLIVDWNFPDDDGAGAILPLPSQDVSVWEKIPAMDVINAVFGVLGEGVVQAQPDPNSSAG